MDEDKQLICDLLCKTLQATRGASDLISLSYNQRAETVTAAFESGGLYVIDVAMDSGTSLIYDVMRQIF